MPSRPQSNEGAAFSRRSLLKGASVAAIASSTVTANETAAAAPVQRFAPGLHAIKLDVNGKQQALEVEPRTTLLDALRDVLDLTGTKQICDRGACGGCTVLWNGEPVNACMMLALDAVGSPITTIEGISTGDELHALQRAFIECDALQCGFCTPGMIMSGVACLQRTAAPTRAEINEAISGNLCRCGTYTRVVEAIEKTAKRGGGR